MSAVFLNLNFLTLTTYLFFNLPATNGISTILRKYMNNSDHKALDTNRQGDITDEIIQ